MLPGILYSGQQITRVTFPVYDASNDTWDIMQDARWGWYNDNGTIRRWAPKIQPPPGVGYVLDSYPSDSDPYFRGHVLTNPTYYDFTFTIEVVRRSTGVLIATLHPTSSFDWASDGGGEWYDLTLSNQLTFDKSIPSEFAGYQVPSDLSTGTDAVQDPRAAT